MYADPTPHASEAQVRQRILVALARFPDLTAQPADVVREGGSLVARVTLGADGPVYQWAFPLPVRAAWTAVQNPN
jgi:hypothetical protein